MPRRAVRFTVRFWRQGQPEEAFIGFATNVSAGGLFVATRQPLPPNAPVELEIEQPERTFRLPGQVMHAARYPPLYQQVFKSGMGVQFRQPDAEAVKYLANLGVPITDRGGRRRFERVV